MVDKISLILLLFTFSSSKLNTNNINLNLSIIKNGLHIDIAQPLLEKNIFDDVASDIDQKVPTQFEPSPFFIKNFKFWLSVYTQYTSDHKIIHDRLQLEIVYKVLDFSKLSENGLNPFAREIIINTYLEDSINEYKTDLLALAKGFTSNQRQEQILFMLSKTSHPPPSDPNKRIAYFKERAESLRSQSGQENMIKNGVKFYNLYSDWFENIFTIAKLPIELRSIPFLESSFNVKAESRVGALGVWQIMPLISSYFLPKRTANIDYRKSVILSTVAAIHLLKENYKILRSWDLAITAYNSGTKHIMTAKKKFSKNNFNLEQYIKLYAHDDIGFASKNFYAEFMALAHALAYKDQIYDTSDKMIEKEWRIYLTLCPLDFNSYQSINLFDDNPQFKTINIKYPRGSIITSHQKLNPKKFYEIKSDVLVERKPKDWSRLILNQSCSTK